MELIVISYSNTCDFLKFMPELKSLDLSLQSNTFGSNCDNFGDIFDNLPVLKGLSSLKIWINKKFVEGKSDCLKSLLNGVKELENIKEF